MEQSHPNGKYLTTEELSQLIKYDTRTIRNRLKDSVLLEGVHYIRPFGRRKILFIREAIERDIDAYLGLLPSPLTSGSTPSAAEPIAVSAKAPPRKLKKASDITLMTPAIPMAAGGTCNV